jgi:hypothetical protein
MMSLERLQAGVPVVCRPVPGSLRTGYPNHSYYDFDYSLTKTANWTWSWPRRLAYLVLATATAGGIDRFRLPMMLEWPQMLLAVLLVGTALVFHGIRNAANLLGVI